MGNGKIIGEQTEGLVLMNMAVRITKEIKKLDR